MAINKKLIHFKNYSDFNSKKLSANEANTTYTVGVGGVTYLGAPDVLYQSICWIKDTKQMWTHGQLYDCSGGSGDVNLSEYLTAEEIAEIYATIESLDGKQDTLVSGTNIKTINGNSILGGGDINMPYYESGGYTYVQKGISDDDLIYALPTSASGAEDDVLATVKTLKTINGQSLIGSGDITISGGESSGGGYPIEYITLTAGANEIQLSPNTYYELDAEMTMSNSTTVDIIIPTISDGIAKEFIFEYKHQDNVSIILDDIPLWVNGAPPSFTEGKRYIISIVSDCGVWAEFSY